jgi:hypothetical protein
MKSISSLVACLIVALPATAMAVPFDDTVVSIPAQKGEYSYHLDSTAYRQFTGEYTLSNGSVLRLAGNNHWMTAQIDQQPVHRIVATSNNSFQAVGHRLALQLNNTDPMDVSGYLEYVDESRKVADISEPMVVRVAFR